MPQRDRGHRLPEQGAALRHAVQGRRRDLAHDRRRPASTWVPRSASSPCCTPGARTCCITRTCTASCPVAASAPDGKRWVACRPGLLPAGAGAVAAVPAPVPRAAARGLRRRASCASSTARRHCRTGRPSTDSWRRRHAAEWVVYAKAPFGGPEQVLEYLGRYTHRVAIANNRLVDFSDGRVAFRWKDYRHEPHRKVMRLRRQEFIRRFLLHVLPRASSAFGTMACWPTVPRGQARTLPRTAGVDRRHRSSSCRPRRGLPRPLSAAHRRVVGGLPGVRARADGVHRDLPAGTLPRGPPAHHHELDLEPSVPALLAARAQRQVSLCCSRQ